MRKVFVLSFVTLSCLSLSTTPVVADGISGAFANTNQTRAGLYLRLPFTGGLKKTEKNQLNYGFAMGFGRTQAGSSLMDARRTFNADMIKLNFNAVGFKSFNVGGQNIYRINRTRLGAVEGESMFTSKNMMYAAAGIGAIVLGVILLKDKKKVCYYPPECTGPPPPQ